MCLAIPGKVLEEFDRRGMRMAKVQFGGIVREASLDYVPSARVGDYVLVHVGFAISTVDKDEAARTYELLEQMDQLTELNAPVIALAIVDGVLEEAERHQARQVEVVHLRLGRLSGVDKEALQFSYGIACQQTALCHSRLVIEDVEVVIDCPACGGERRAQFFPLLLCSVCGAAAERVVRGKELEISRLEITA